MSTDEFAVSQLIARYAFLVDDGDFAGLGELLADAEFRLGDRVARGRDDVVALAHEVLQLYSDGTPRTRHVTTNLLIDVAGPTATSRSYFTVLQQTEGFPLQPIACGRYRDRFEQVDGRWRFAAREVSTDLVGDLGHHRRPAA